MSFHIYQKSVANVGQTACQNQSRMGKPERSDLFVFWKAPAYFLVLKTLSTCLIVFFFLLLEGEQVTAQPVNDPGTEKVPDATTANTVPSFDKEVNVSSVTKAAPGQFTAVDCNNNTHEKIKHIQIHVSKQKRF